MEGMKIGSEQVAVRRAGAVARPVEAECMIVQEWECILTTLNAFAHEHDHILIIGRIRRYMAEAKADATLLDKALLIEVTPDMCHSG